MREPSRRRCLNGYPFGYPLNDDYRQEAAASAKTDNRAAMSLEKEDIRAGESRIYESRVGHD